MTITLNWRRLAFVLSLAALLAGCDNPFNKKFSDAEMKVAAEQAQSGWEAFVARARQPQPGDEGFSVKVRLTDGKMVEHIWLTDLKLDQEPMLGTIVDSAQMLKGVEAGLQCKFTRAEISDWMYRHNGKIEGNFTLRALLKHLPPAEAEALKKQAGWE